MISRMLDWVASLGVGFASGVATAMDKVNIAFLDQIQIGPEDFDIAIKTLIVAFSAGLGGWLAKKFGEACVFGFKKCFNFFKKRKKEIKNSNGF